MDHLLNEVLTFWNSNFPDVPCLSQKIFIKSLPNTAPTKFRLIVSGDYSSLKLEPFLFNNLNELQFLSEENYKISESPIDGSILIESLNSSDLNLSGFTFECLNSPTDKLNILVYQYEIATPETWVSCYNFQERNSSFLLELDNTISPHRLDGSKDLYDFIFYLIEGKEKNAAHIFEKSVTLQANKLSLQIIVDKFERQLNAHGLKRTFKFWSNLQKENYLRGSKSLISLLKKKFPNTCIGFGAVLGLERDKDLIGHDDDIDIIVALPLALVKNLPIALNLIAVYLLKNGYKIEGIFFGHLWVRTLLGDRVDVFVGLIEQDFKLSVYPSARKNLLYKDIFPTKDSILYSVKLPFPNSPQVYLSKTYGEQWQTPNINFAHPWDRLSYADLDGPRKIPATFTRGELFKLKNPTC